MKLTLEDVAFSYGKETFLHDTSAELTPGAITVLAGPNGAGKSTILRLLSGYLAPQTGKIMLDGEELKRISSAKRARCIGVVSQTPPPALGFTVRELVELCARPRLPRRGNLPEKESKCIQAAMEHFEVAEFADIPANRLSGGELARVRLAGMAALAPEILLLDEPTAALDPAFRNRAMAWCGEYARNHALLMITHDLELVARAKRVWLLGLDGKLTAGTADELLTQSSLTGLYGTPATVETKENKQRRITFDCD